MVAAVGDASEIGFRRLSGAIGAEVLGVDLTSPLDDDVQSQLRAALAEFRLLLVRDERISATDQADFAKVFGNIVIH